MIIKLKKLVYDLAKIEFLTVVQWAKSILKCWCLHLSKLESHLIPQNSPVLSKAPFCFSELPFLLSGPLSWPPFILFKMDCLAAHMTAKTKLIGLEKALQGDSDKDPVPKRVTGINRVTESLLWWMRPCIEPLIEIAYAKHFLVIFYPLTKRKWKWDSLARFM